MFKRIIINHHHVFAASGFRSVNVIKMLFLMIILNLTTTTKKSEKIYYVKP
jgi:hypothetical protein